MIKQDMYICIVLHTQNCEYSMRQILLIKPGAPGFLKSLQCGCMCVSVCVRPPGY